MCGRHGAGGLPAKGPQREKQPNLAPEGRVLRTQRALGKHTSESAVAEGLIARRCVKALLALLPLGLLLSRFSDEETEAGEVK